MAGKFETFTGSDGKHYFKLKAGNGEVILQSQGYKAKDDCANGIESVRKNAADEGRFEVKTAADGKHYFVLTATNGQTIGKSQMYKTESGCSNGVESVRNNAAEAAITET
jgi:uncharacterized protein YegP (UPF0339 family)